MSDFEADLWHGKAHQCRITAGLLEEQWRRWDKLVNGGFVTGAMADKLVEAAEDAKDQQLNELIMAETFEARAEGRVPNTSRALLKAGIAEQTPRLIGGDDL